MHDMTGKECSEYVSYSHCSIWQEVCYLPMLYCTVLHNIEKFSKPQKFQILPPDCLHHDESRNVTVQGTLCKKIVFLSALSVFFSSSMQQWWFLPTDPHQGSCLLCKAHARNLMDLRISTSSSVTVYIQFQLIPEKDNKLSYALKEIFLKYSAREL